MTKEQIKAEYAPYDQMPEFDFGRSAYERGDWFCPFQGVGQQAWERGQEYAMRTARIK